MDAKTLPSFDTSYVSFLTELHTAFSPANLPLIDKLLNISWCRQIKMIVTPHLQYYLDRRQPEICDSIDFMWIPMGVKSSGFWRHG
jgi:hypothetical protein